MILKNVWVITDGQNYFRKAVISSTSGNYVAVFALPKQSKKINARV